MKHSELIDFIEGTLNEHNKYDNARAFDAGRFGDYQHTEIRFMRNHSKLYAQLLSYCAEHGGIIIKTQPATYCTIVRTEVD